MNFLSISTWLISLIAFAYTLLNADKSTYPLIYLLPLTLWVLSTLFFKVYYYYQKSWVFKVFILQAIVRYPVMAVAYCMENSISSKYPFYNSSVIIIMVIELTVCFITLAFLSKKQYNSYLHKNNKLVINTNYLFIYLMLFIMLAYIFASNTFSQINFILSIGDYVDKYVNNNEELTISSLGGVLFTPFKTLLALTIIQKVYSSNIRNKLKKWIYLAVIVASSSFIFGLSRFSLILFTIPILAFITILISEKEAKDLARYSSIILFVALLLASLAKFSRYGDKATANDLIDAGSINAYFSGPDNIATGLAAFDSVTNLNPLLFLLNDTFQNVPILSKLTSDNYKLNIVFNKQFYGHNLYADQIVPLDISGLFHFGWLGMPFYYCFFLVIALYFERLFHRSSRFLYKYVWISLSISLSYIFMMNVSSFYTSISSTLLFLLLPFWLLNFFGLRKVMK